MSPRFTPRQLDAFLAVAELQSFRLAALRMNLTPSAISSLVAELEGALEFALFHRTTRSVALTNEGRRFLPSAIAVQRQIAQTQSVANEIRDGAIDVVRIAAPLVVAATILPRLIADWPRPSDIEIRIVDTPVVWLIDRVAIGDADLAIGPDRVPPQSIERTILFETPWYLWLRPDDPLGKSEAIPWRMLQSLELIAAGRDHENSVWPQLIEAGAPIPGKIQVVEHVTTSLGLAANALGATFAPNYIRPLAESFSLIGRPLIEPKVNRQLCLYERKNERRSRSTERVIELIKSIYPL